MRSTVVRRERRDITPFLSPSQDLLDYREEMGRRALRPGSIDARMGVLVRIETALGHPLIAGTRDELRAWLDDHKLGARSRYSYISHMASFWRWALTDERSARSTS